MSEATHREHLRAELLERRAERERLVAARARAERVAIIVAFALVLLAIAEVILAGDGILPLPVAPALLIAVLLVAAGLAFRARATERKERARFAVAFLDAELARLDGHAPPGAKEGTAHGDPDHAYVQDLDVFGPRSLFELVDATRTPLGEDALAARLRGEGLAPRAARQELLRHLAGASAAREAFAVELDAFAAAESDPVRREQRDKGLRALSGGGLPAVTAGAGPLHRILARVLPLVFLALFSAWVLGALPFWPVLVSWLVNGGVSLLGRDLAPFAVHLESVARGLRDLGRCAQVAEERLAEGPAALSALARPFPELSSSESFRRLHAGLALLEQRRNPVYALTVGVGLVTELRARNRVFDWLAEEGERLGARLRALADLEAECSLAAHVAARPEDAWPQETASEEVLLQAEALAHPLLPVATRVANDLEVVRRGDVLLITGSNMSGKSTFLRALGLAAVMARVGLPVAARSFRARDLAVFTCMRVHDSLQEGSSRFHAEVHRLKACVEGARAHPPALVLFDEILAGTNSRERHLGTKAVLLDLAREDAALCVATHDLELVELERSLGSHVRVHHFRDDVRQGVMSFDYTLRAGPCPSTNALRVMRDAGLPVPDED